MAATIEDVPIASIELGERYRRDLGDIPALARSIREVGLLHPIVIDRVGRLIVGQRRLLACQHLGWETIPARVVDLADALMGDLAENVIRKDFIPTEKQAIAAVLAPRMATPVGRPAAGNEQKFSSFPRGKTLDKAARAVGWSGPTLEKANEVVQAAADNPDRDGDLPAKMDRRGVDGAYKELLRRRKQAAREPPPGLEAIPTVLGSGARPYRLICGELEDAADELLSESIDVIVTDPPYPQEYLPLHETLARVAARVLKPGGSLVAMVGHIYLPEILAMMTPHIRYQWTLAYLTGSPSTAVHSRKALVGWKPVLWFVKGDYTGEAISDVCRSDRMDKTYHDWGQSENGFDELLYRFARYGDTVLDPFVGGGTCGVVALARGCSFIGIDRDVSALWTTEARLTDLLQNGIGPDA